MRRSVSFLTMGLLLTACVDPPGLVVQPLRVINWLPAGGAICVGVNTTVRATFSDDIVTGSLDEESFQLLSPDGAVPGSVGYDKQTYTASFTPTDALGFGRLHTVALSTAIRGADQGALAVELSSSFVTVERQGCTPGVQCSLPSECDATQICSNIGLCIDECVTDKDCSGGTCVSAACVHSGPQDGAGGGDPGPGDTVSGD